MPLQGYQLSGQHIRAVRFDPCGEHKDHLPDGVKGVAPYGADNWCYEGCMFMVERGPGESVKVRSGDWIVQGPANYLHVWPDAVFQSLVVSDEGFWAIAAMPEHGGPKDALFYGRGDMLTKDMADAKTFRNLHAATGEHARIVKERALLRRESDAKDYVIRVVKVR